MIRSRFTALAALCAATLCLVAAPVQAQNDEQKVVDGALRSFNNFLNDPQMEWLRANVGNAKGILISSEVVKAGFIVGGSGGRAVLIARNPKTGKWVGPAFYTLATASVGFQAGVSVSEVMTLVMTDKALNSLLSASVKFGPDASIAAGPVGAGATADIVTDLVTYSRSKGVYGGLNLDGTAVTIAEAMNRAYYRKDLLPPAILLATPSPHNKGSDALLAAVTRATAKKKK